MSRAIDLVKPLMAVVPEVEEPEEEVPFGHRVMWSSMCLFIFLVCSQIPLYGIAVAKTTDPFYWMRVILASNRGTLMELGVSPIISAGMIMQVLVGAKIIDCDMEVDEDHYLHEGATKILAFTMAVGEAVAYVWSGMYGPVDELGSTAYLLVAQLIFAGVLMVLIDETMTIGYGIGSGINLFIACNVCETIFWKCFSPTTLSSGKGTEFEGAIVSVVHGFSTKSDKLGALRDAFYRQSGPNLTNLMATLLVCAVVIYFQGFRVDLPIKHQRARGATGTYPVKLFYTTTTPIILQTAVVSNIYFLSQILYNRVSRNPIVNLIGRWQETPYGYSIPVGGLAYYISPPQTFSDLWEDPVHGLTYISFVLVSCAFFSRAWTAISGSSPHDVAKSLRDREMTFVGHRDVSIVHVLNQHIPIAATFGGMCIGMLTIMSDFLGAIGSGTGILLAVTTIYAYYEILTDPTDKDKYAFTDY